MSLPLRTQMEGLADQFRVDPTSAGGVIEATGRVWVIGVGGSGMAGEFLAHAVRPGMELVPWRDASLPDAVHPSDTVLCMSYSGETNETLSAWRAAGARGLPRAAVASGGTLWREAERENVPRARVPQGLAPRCALGYLVRGGSAVLPTSAEIPWLAAAAHLDAVRARWVGERASELASRLNHSLPALLAARGMLAVASRRWSGELAENAKLPSLIWTLPEAAHNAIMAVASEAPKPLPLVPIALGTPREPAARLRWDTTLAVLNDAGVRVERVDEPHPDAWVEALGLAHVGSWVSMAAAAATDTDPESLSLMTELKQRLKRGAEGNHAS